MDCIVHGVAKSWTRLSDFHFTLLIVPGPFQVALVVKNPAANAGDLGSIPELERSSEEGKSYPLQYSGLENSMDCAVHGVAKSRT